MNLLISIIIPCHNSIEYLESSVASCLNQSYNNFEIILVENGSSDNTWQMCQTLASKHSQIRILQSSPSKKVGGARNLGISEAKGHYVFFLDDDDEITYHAFRDLLNYSQDGNADIVVGKRTNIWLDGSESITSYTPSGIFENILLNNRIFIFYAIHAKLYKKTFLLENNILFPESIVYSEDFYFSMLVVIFAKTTIVLPNFCDSIYTYIVRVDSAVSNWSNKFDFFIANLITSIDLTLDVWGKISNDDKKLTEMLGYQYTNYKDESLELANKYMQTNYKRYINYILNAQISSKHKRLYINKMKESGIVDRIKALYQEEKSNEPFIPILSKSHIMYLIKLLTKAFIPVIITKKFKKNIDLFNI